MPATSSDRIVHAPKTGNPLRVRHFRNLWIAMTVSKGISCLRCMDDSVRKSPSRTALSKPLDSNDRLVAGGSVLLDCPSMDRTLEDGIKLGLGYDHDGDGDS